jgi:hypothetical protein
MSFPDNIFVLCTGRCGSMTLAKACAHLTDRTSAHESRTHLLGPARLAYPPRHIEIDNRLSWILGRLDRDWGDRAAYVHLTRNPEEIARSYAARGQHGIMRAYRTGIVYRAQKLTPGVPMIDFARDYVDTVTENIRLFLRDKSHVMTMALESLATDFDRFVAWSGSTGDLDAARAQLAIQHNATRDTPWIQS